MTYMSPFYNSVDKICRKDSRFKPDAYEFVMEALHYTQDNLKRQGHVSGRELLDGIRLIGLKKFGALAKTVFEHWGVKTTDDFGEIVFNMVDNGILSKTERDTSADFRSVYDFEDAFREDPDANVNI